MSSLCRPRPSDPFSQLGNPQIVQLVRSGFHRISSGILQDFVLVPITSTTL